MTLFKNLSVKGLCLALFTSSVLAAASPSLLPRSYFVARGDCLWTIAAGIDVFGDAWQWPLLLKANPKRIDNPDRIQPGWRLDVPRAVSWQDALLAKAYAQNYNEEGVIYQAPVMASMKARRELPLQGMQQQPAALPMAQPEKGMGSMGALAWITLLVAFAGFCHLGIRLVWPMPLKAPAKEPVPSALAASQAGPQPTESEAILRAMADTEFVIPPHEDTEELKEAA